MRLRHQALIVLVCVGCVGSGGCARLLGTFLAPQEAAMDTASRVANAATAPAQQDVNAMGQELNRLLASQTSNQAELRRVMHAFDQQLDAYVGVHGSAQTAKERLRPWHPRLGTTTMFDAEVAVDQLNLGRPMRERGLADLGPLPRGIPAAELITPMNTAPVRLPRNR